MNIKIMSKVIKIIKKYVNVDKQGSKSHQATMIIDHLGESEHLDAK